MSHRTRTLPCGIDGSRAVGAEATDGSLQVIGMLNAPADFAQPSPEWVGTDRERMDLQ